MPSFACLEYSKLSKIIESSPPKRGTGSNMEDNVIDHLRNDGSFYFLTISLYFVIYFKLKKAS